MLVIFPDPAADSFVTLLEAEQIIIEYTLDHAKWTALPDTEKEALLRIAFKLINDNIVTPITVANYDACLKSAQTLIASHDNVYGLSKGASIQTTGAIKKQKAGPVEREFYEPDRITDNPLAPQIVYPCLDIYGFTLSRTSGFRQSILGRS